MTSPDKPQCQVRDCDRPADGALILKARGTIDVCTFHANKKNWQVGPMPCKTCNGGQSKSPFMPCPDCNGTGVQTPKTEPRRRITGGGTTSITPPTSFAAEVREVIDQAQADALAIHAYHRHLGLSNSLTDADYDRSQDKAVAAITAAYERDMEQFVEDAKLRAQVGGIFVMSHDTIAFIELMDHQLAEQRARINQEPDNGA